MRRILLTLLLALPATALSAQQVTYSLPRTVIAVEVDAVREVRFAGPYAAYAKQMLGLDVPQKNEYATYIREIRISSKVEADHEARLQTAPSKAVSELLTLSSLGLVSFSGSGEAKAAVWNFRLPENASGSADGEVSNPYMMIKQTVYKDVKTDTSFTRVAIEQDVKVAKTFEQKAQEAADMVLRAREERFKITIGDTDATFSGEALGAAIAELTRVEKEYLEMFTGYTVRTEESKTFEVIPVKGTDSYDVFRLSDTEGVLPADAKAGKPYYMDVIPSAPSVPRADESVVKASKGGSAVVCRIPAVCAVTLGTGTTPLSRLRIPVYQLGEESVYYVK